VYEFAAHSSSQSSVDLIPLDLLRSSKTNGTIPVAFVAVRAVRLVTCKRLARSFHRITRQVILLRFAVFNPVAVSFWSAVAVCKWLSIGGFYIVNLIHNFLLYKICDVNRFYILKPGIRIEGNDCLSVITGDLNRFLQPSGSVNRIDTELS